MSARLCGARFALYQDKFAKVGPRATNVAVLEGALVFPDGSQALLALSPVEEVKEGIKNLHYFPLLPEMPGKEALTNLAERGQGQALFFVRRSNEFPALYKIELTHHLTPKPKDYVNMDLPGLRGSHNKTNMNLVYNVLRALRVSYTLNR